MGSAASTGSDQHMAHERRSIEEVVTVMMPVYYTKEPVSPEDHEMAKRTWDMILDDTSPQYVQSCTVAGFKEEYPSCIMFFYDTFYRRLFDVHPMCKPMFKNGMKSQGKALVKIVTLSLSMYGDDAKFDSVLSRLAENHNQRGIKAVEYGIMGESLIWALRACLGPLAMDPDSTRAWVRVFCRMFRIIIPLAVAHELRGGNAQKQRMQEMEVISGVSSLDTSKASSQNL